MKQGLLNNNAVTSIHFHPRQPQHFIASFSDGIVLQFNIFAEDPIAAAIPGDKPWMANLNAEMPPSPTVAVDEDGYEEKMLLWKNEDWAQLSVEVQKGKKDERSPWAGKNPTAAVRIGNKSVTGEFGAVLMKYLVSPVAERHSPGLFPGWSLALISSRRRYAPTRRYHRRPLNRYV